MLIAATIGLVCAVLSSRVILLIARGGWFADFSTRQGLLSQLMGGAMLPAQIALIALGFVVATWWVWLGIVLVTLFVMGALVTRSTFPFFFQLRTLLDLTAIGCAVFGWATYLELV